MKKIVMLAMTAIVSWCVYADEWYCGTWTGSLDCRTSDHVGISDHGTYTMILDDSGNWTSVCTWENPISNHRKGDNHTCDVIGFATNIINRTADEIVISGYYDCGGRFDWRLTLVKGGTSTFSAWAGSDCHMEGPCGQVNDCKFLYSDNGDGTITLQGVEGTISGKLIIPATYAGRAVSAIGDRAFKGCRGLTSIELEEGIVSIGEFSFAGYNPIGNLSSVKIPSSVTSIGRGAFTINTLTSITLADANGRFNVVDGVLYDKVDKRTICACLNVKHVTLPSDCETIGEDTFSSGWSATSSQLETVIWPKSLKTIEQSAFHECRKFTSGDLSNTQLELIEEDEFVMCTALTTMIFPKTLKYLTGHDFSCCSSLRSVYFLGNAPEILMKTSRNKDMLDCIYVTTADLDKNYSDDTQYEYSYLPNVMTYVTENSTGWGNVPGTWQGCPVKYWDGTFSEMKPVGGCFTGEKAMVLNGLAYDVNSNICGIVQIKAAKATKKGVRVSGFVMLENGKKQTLKATTVPIENGLLKVLTRIGKLGTIALTIDGNGFTGTMGDMKVASALIGEDTGIIGGTLKMRYFDAKTGKIKAKSIKLTGVAADSKAIGGLTVKGQSEKSFEAKIVAE